MNIAWRTETGLVPDSVQVGAQKKNPRKLLKCYGCGQLGHFRRHCYNVKKQVSSATFHKARTAEEEHYSYDNDAAFGASVGFVSDPQHGQWLVDSGATSRMTPEKELLMNYHQFEEHELLVWVMAGLLKQ